MTKFRALSLWQPWASAVFLPVGAPAKQVETRSYATDYRGRLYIHATLKTPDVEYLKLIQQDGFKEAHTGLMKHDPVPAERYYEGSDFWAYMGHAPHGMLLGYVDLVDCMEAAAYHKWAENNVPREQLNRDFLWGDLSSGRFAFILKNPVKFDSPIPAKGTQSFGWDCEKYLPEYAKLL